MRTKKLIVGVTAGVSALSFLRGQLNWFAHKGWEVVLVSNPDEKASLAAKGERVRLEGIPMSREISVKEDFRALIRWIRLLQSENPSAVNVGTPKAGLLGTIAAFIMRVPTRLYVVRGLRLEGTSGKLFVLLWMVEKLIMLLATDVFFVSESLAQKASALNLAPVKKSWLIGNGSSNGVPAHQILRTISTVEPIKLRREIGLEADDFVVGFIGRINRDKGVDLLINALESKEINHRVKVLFVGGVENSALGDYLRKLGNKVVLVPWVENPWEYLPAMDILCLPSLREGFPNVVLEAAVAGVPSIVTSATGAVDSVVSGETGIILEDRDPLKLARQINDLASNSKELTRLGKQARKRAISLFAPERIWHGILEILESKEHYEYARKFQSNIR